MVDEVLLSRDRLAKDIVGEIVLSENPEKIIRKWRSIFNFSQKKISAHLGITSSVISDYESGRRKSPGINVIKRYVEALLFLDMKRGGHVIKSFTGTLNAQGIPKSIVDIREFSSGVKIYDFCRAIDSPLLTKNIGSLEREIYGYTVIDSVKAISELSFSQLINLYGTTTQRALVFTNVSTGRTPMVAIKLTSLQPGLVILHGTPDIDEVAINIAEAENIPLAICKLDALEDVVNRLRKI